MKQERQLGAGAPANDNVPKNTQGENTDHNEAVAHLYVGKHGRERQAWKPTCIMTDLPEKLGIMSGEVALIRGFMGELVGRILANDNEKP